MDVNGVQGSIGASSFLPKKSDKVGDSKSSESAKTNRAANIGPDEVLISEEALEIQKLAGGGKSEFLSFLQENVSDVRSDKISAAKAKLESGEFDSPETIENLADKLLGVL